MSFIVNYKAIIESHSGHLIHAIRFWPTLLEKSRCDIGPLRSVGEIKI